MGHTTITLDEELREKARLAQINISALTEDAIRKKLNLKEIDVSESLKCEFCGREGYIETAEMVKPTTNTIDPVELPNALTWLCPDEKWICNKCLRIKAKMVSVARL